MLTIIGQDNIIRCLDRMYGKNKLEGEFIILSGPTSIGKTSIAKIYTSRILTDNEQEQDVIYNNLSKYKEVQGAEIYNLSGITNEELSSLLDVIKYSEHRKERRVLILDEAHNLSKANQDLLLLSLENISSYLTIFLCTTEVYRLRDALRARATLQCPLRDLSSDEVITVASHILIEKRLQFDITTPLVALHLARACNYNIRYLTTITKELPTDTRMKLSEINVIPPVDINEYLKLLVAVTTNNTLEAISLVNKFDDTRDLLTMLSEILVVIIGGKSKLIDNQEESYIKSSRLTESISTLQSLVSEMLVIGDNISSDQIKGLIFKYTLEKNKKKPRGENNIPKTIGTSEINKTIKEIHTKKIANGIKDKGGNNSFIDDSLFS